MVKVRNGFKTKAKRHNPAEYNANLCQKSKSGIVFFCSSASRIESGKYIVLLTAIARQCSVYRTVILRNKPDKIKAEELLKKWAKKLPLKDIA